MPVVAKKINPLILNRELQEAEINTGNLLINFNDETVSVDFVGNYNQHDLAKLTSVINNHPRLDIFKDYLGEQNLTECASRQDEITKLRSANEVSSWSQKKLQAERYNASAANPESRNLGLANILVAEMTAQFKAANNGQTPSNTQLRLNVQALADGILAKAANYENASARLDGIRSVVWSEINALNSTTALGYDVSSRWTQLEKVA